MSVDDRRQKITVNFQKKFGDNPSTITAQHLRFLLKEYDRLFLNNELKNVKVRFRTKSVSPFMAAYTEWDHNDNMTLVIDSYLLNNINFAQSTAGGIKCNSKIVCTQLLFEHELVHILLFLKGETYQTHGHNKRFLALLNQLFGHNSYTTSIINSIIQRVHDDTKLQKGDQVWLRSAKNPKLEFMGVIRDIVNNVYIVQSYTGEELALGKENVLFYYRTK